MVRDTAGPLSASGDSGPAVSRTIEIRSDQTLADLHLAIFTAFGRHEEHLYEIQLSGGRRCILPLDGLPEGTASVLDTTLADLHLQPGDRFGYLFDFATDWWHPITVLAVSKKIPKGDFPRVTGRVGDDPPEDLVPEAPESDGRTQDLAGSAADAACLIGEMHLRQGDHGRAIEAFTRAIESRPTADAYEGRAKAFRGLAFEDEGRARELRRKQRFPS
jgi:hypothetical protein